MAGVEQLLRSDEHHAPAADEARAKLEGFYRAHARQVFAICLSVVRDRHEAEDASQQVFVSAFRALLRGAGPHDPGAWLAAIARNESWSRARRQPCVPIEPELCDVSQEDPSTLAVRRGELARVWQAIESLPASQREALLLREVRGLGYDELADDLRLSHPSVRSLLNRARRTLRNQLEKGAAALTGAPWLNITTRLIGDGSSPALSSASRTAAVGLGTLALGGGALVAPSLTGPSRHHRVAPAAQPVAQVIRSRSVPERDGVAVPSATALRRPATPRVEDRVSGRDSRGGSGRERGVGEASGARSGREGARGGDSASDAHDERNVSSGEGSSDSISSSGSSSSGDYGTSRADGGSGSGDAGTRSTSADGGSGGTSGSGDSSSADTSSSVGSQTPATSTSASGDGHSVSSGRPESDGGSTNSGSLSTSDGDGGSSSSAGPDGGSDERDDAGGGGS